MNKAIKFTRTIFASLLLMISTLSWAYDFCVDGIYYNRNSDYKSASVTYYISARYSGKIVIPSTIIYYGDTLEVTKVDTWAFHNCSSLTSIEIPNSVTSIGSSAFEGCSSLEEAKYASVESMCNISYSDEYSNPCYYAKNLYIDGKSLTP